MTVEIPTSVWLMSWKLAAQEEELKTAIKSIVKGYYRNYTDATELEDDAVRLLRNVIDMTGDLVELDELVVEAERELNEQGGVISDTDGTSHQVRSNWAWNDNDDEKDN